MEALQIMPIMAQNQSRFNLGEYAEEAAIIQDEPTVQPSVNIFCARLYSFSLLTAAEHLNSSFNNNKLNNLLKETKCQKGLETDALTC